MNIAPSNDDALLHVGAARYMPSGIVRFDRYRSGETAIEIVDQRGEPQYVATVALASYGAPDPGECGVWLKGWSENEGVPQALAQAGIVTLTGRTQKTGFCHAQHATLTERARAVLHKQGAVLSPQDGARDESSGCNRREPPAQLVSIHAELRDAEAWLLAQFIKRLRFDQCYELTDNGKAQSDREEQAYAMLAAMGHIGRALGAAGYTPR